MKIKNLIGALFDLVVAFLWMLLGYCIGVGYLNDAYNLHITLGMMFPFLF